MSDQHETHREIQSLLSALLTQYTKAIVAHDTAVKVVESEDLRARLVEHSEGVKKHVLELRMHADSLNLEMPAGAGLGSLLTSGVVATGALAGDDAVLKSLHSIEEKIVDEVESASRRGNLSDALKAALNRQVSDAYHRRHWLCATLGVHDPVQKADEDEVVRGRAVPRTEIIAQSSGQTADV